MAEAADLLAQLLSRQNRDGGWGCGTSSSWTEPTALAILALIAHHASPQHYSEAHGWLLAQQRPDGGWPPNASVPVSTCVTSVACLAASAVQERGAHERAVHWILGQVQPDRGPVERLAFWLEQMPSQESVMGGSSWYPGTAAWVAPTVTSVLALSDARTSLPHLTAQLDRAVDRGRAYILSRTCSGGGWNHGGTQFRSESAPPYPEMTGMALLAFAGPPNGSPEKHLELAERMQQAPGSGEAQSWLTLALRKHGRPVRPPEHEFTPRTARELTLQLLAMSGATACNKLL